MNIQHTRLRGRAGLLAVGAGIPISMRGRLLRGGIHTAVDEHRLGHPEAEHLLRRRVHRAAPAQGGTRQREVQRRSVLERHVVPLRRGLVKADS